MEMELEDIEIVLQKTERLLVDLRTIEEDDLTQSYLDSQRNQLEAYNKRFMTSHAAWRKREGVKNVLKHEKFGTMIDLSLQIDFEIADLSVSLKQATLSDKHLKSVTSTEETLVGAIAVSDAPAMAASSDRSSSSTMVSHTDLDHAASLTEIPQGSAAISKMLASAEHAGRSVSPTTASHTSVKRVASLTEIPQGSAAISKVPASAAHTGRSVSPTTASHTSVKRVASPTKIPQAGAAISKEPAPAEHASRPVSPTTASHTSVKRVASLTEIPQGSAAISKVPASAAHTGRSVSPTTASHASVKRVASPIEIPQRGAEVSRMPAAAAHSGRSLLMTTPSHISEKHATSSMETSQGHAMVSKVPVPAAHDGRSVSPTTVNHTSAKRVASLTETPQGGAAVSKVPAPAAHSERSLLLTTLSHTPVKRVAPPMQTPPVHAAVSKVPAPAAHTGCFGLLTTADDTKWKPVASNKETPSDTMTVSEALDLAAPKGHSVWWTTNKPSTLKSLTLTRKIPLEATVALQVAALAAHSGSVGFSAPTNNATGPVASTWRMSPRAVVTSHVTDQDVSSGQPFWWAPTTIKFIIGNKQFHRPLWRPDPGGKSLAFRRPSADGAAWASLLTTTSRDHGAVTDCTTTIQRFMDCRDRGLTSDREASFHGNVEELRSITSGCRRPLSKPLDLVAQPAEDNPVLHRSSLLPRLLRVTALCFRFHNVQDRTTRRVGLITWSESNSAFNRWIRIAQQQDFAEELAKLGRKQAIPALSPLMPLRPFLDNNGLLRLGGRLHPRLPFEEKRSLILAKSNHISLLMEMRIRPRSMEDYN